MKIFNLLTIKWLMVGVMPFALAGCAIPPKRAHHSFSFDARWDSPDVEVLDYRYGDPDQHGDRPSEDMRKEGRSNQSANVGGLIEVAKSLYVKWRIKETGEIFEDLVDLRRRLPGDMEGVRVYFEIRGKQLYVYLISPERRPLGWPKGPLKEFTHLKVFTIYPDQRK